MNLSGSLPEREFPLGLTLGTLRVLSLLTAASTRKQGSLRCRYGSGEGIAVFEKRSRSPVFSELKTARRAVVVAG